MNELQTPVSQLSSHLGLSSKQVAAVHHRLDQPWRIVAKLGGRWESKDILKVAALLRAGQLLDAVIHSSILTQDVLIDCIRNSEWISAGIEPADLARIQLLNAAETIERKFRLTQRITVPQE